MTEKDYNAIAEIIQYRRTVYKKDNNVDCCLVGLEFDLAELFAKDNKRFKIEKFRRACYPKKNIADCDLSEKKILDNAKRI